MPGKVAPQVVPKIIKKKKLSESSLQVLHKHIIPFLSDRQDDDETRILTELIQIILTGDEARVKEHYSALVTFLVLKNKTITYDKFFGAFECVDSNKGGVASALIYGTVVVSGVIFKWSLEHQNQIVSKLLRIYLDDPDTASLVFQLLLALDNRVKLSTRNLKKVSVESPIQLYFMLSVDSKRDDVSPETSVFDQEGILGVVDVFLKETKDPDIYKKVCDLLAKKILSFDGDIVVKKFWKKLLAAYSRSSSEYKDVAITQLLSSLLENHSKRNFDIRHVITTPAIKIFSNLSPRAVQILQSVTNSLNKITPLEGGVKLDMIDSIIFNVDKYVERTPAVKICEALSTNLNFEDAKTLAETYRSVILSEKMKTSEAEFIEFEKIYCIRCFGKLISLNSCKYETEWRRHQLKFLFSIGFTGEYRDRNSNQIAGFSRKTFFLCLNQKFAKLSDLNDILRKLVKFVGEKISEKDKTLIVPFKDKAYDLWFKTLSVVKRLNEKTEDTTVFEALFRYMMLFMFSDFNVAKKTLEELFEVMETREKHFSGLHWTEVTTDLFLHLISGDDNCHKNIVYSTFSHVCKHMTINGLNLILSAVAGKVEDDDDEMTDDGSSDSSGSDEESEKGEEEEGSDSEDSDGSVEDKGGHLDALKDSLRKELYQTDTASTCGSVDLDQMDPDEGKHLDSALGRIFKDAQVKTKAPEKVDQAELHFRIRAVTLLEIYLENNPSLNFTTIIVAELISLLKKIVPNNSLVPLVNSIRRCLKTLTDLKKFSNCDGVTETSLCEVLNRLLVKNCDRTVYQDITNQLVESYLFVVKSSVHLPVRSDELKQHMETTIQQFFQDKNTVVPFSLLNSLVSTLPLDRSICLVSSVVEFAFDNDVKLNKRTQALQLLVAFYNNNRIFKEIDTSKKKLIKIEKDILNKYINCIDKLEGAETNKEYCCMLLDLLCLLKSKSELIEQESGEHWNSVKEIVERLSRLAVYRKELKIAFAKFCKMFKCDLAGQSASPTPMSKKMKKRKSQSMTVNGGVDTDTMPKKKSKT